MRLRASSACPFRLSRKTQLKGPVGEMVRTTGRLTGLTVGWRTAVHADQMYITSLLTNVLGIGPAAVAAAEIGALDHCPGSFGAKHAIPLWRDADATQPNISSGLVEYISDSYKKAVAHERLFAYAYGILAQPDYVRRFT